jgi:alkaline phosphatase D
MYFSDTDDDGHKYGPESQEARHAVERLDQMFGNLRKGLAETEVPVNIFVVGDHGMMPIREQAVLGTREEFPGFVVSPTSGAQVMLYARDKSLVEPAYRKLRAKMAADKTATGKTRWVVYKKAELPEYLHYRDSGRIGDLVVMARTRVALTLPVAGAALPKYSAGEHGYNVKWFPEMRTIFYAQGPNLKQHQTIGEFDNVNVYPLIAELLGLKPPANLDGNSKVLQGILKR